jgi:hypothetical protein
MSLQLLKLLGHEIVNSGWGEDSKRVVWTACTTAFFGSLRPGEMLSTSEKSYDPSTILRWKDIKILDDDSILIHLRNPKSGVSEFVDLFSFSDSSCCPVKSMIGLKLHTERRNDFCETKPIFMFVSGKLLSSETLTSIMRNLLQKHIGRTSNQLSAHSFRAAIPSIMAKFPDLADSADISTWGRWQGTSYRLYTRLKKKQRAAIYSKVMKAIQNDK